MQQIVKEIPTESQQHVSIANKLKNSTLSLIGHAKWYGISMFIGWLCVFFDLAGLIAMLLAFDKQLMLMIIVHLLFAIFMIRSAIVATTSSIVWVVDGGSKTRESVQQHDYDQAIKMLDSVEKTPSYHSKKLSLLITLLFAWYGVMGYYIWLQ